MDAVMKMLAAFLIGALALIYLLFWISFMSFVIVGLTGNLQEAVKLFYQTDGPDGITGPLFLWFLVIANPIVLFILWRRWFVKGKNNLKGTL
jgi:hypothetical protein